MGIKHFFIWFKKNFSDSIHKMPRNTNLEDINIEIDNLMLDMNGIFHNSAQKVYEYGNYKPPPRLIQPKKSINYTRLQLRFFQDVCATINYLFTTVKPKKRLLLCIDGPAPLSKQNQQRQRRFRNSAEAKCDDECEFDSNSITPGTKMMDYLSKYIDWYIRQRVNSQPEWQNIEVILSNEKVPGEGEHKLINYMRSWGRRQETYCIYGLDADLIMLALGTHYPNFYILREDIYDSSNEFFLIDIGQVHDCLSEIIKWKHPREEYNKEYGINDFIFLCFIVGNDFLPNIPSIEIIESGIELILDVYRQVGTGFGHITNSVSGNIRFVPRNMKVFMHTIGFYEKENLENKLLKKNSCFKDPLLESCSTQQDGKWIVNIEKYKQSYMTKKLQGPESHICHAYLTGMQWVLQYYTSGVPDWKWNFKYHYAPPASILCQYLDSFQMPRFNLNIPTTPFQQLLCVLPPKSANLIPYPLNDLLRNPASPLASFYPTEFEIDLSGKRKEWEGIVILPMVDFEMVRDVYFRVITQVCPKELKRNVVGKSFLYRYNQHIKYHLKSFYGDIPECRVKNEIIIM